MITAVSISPVTIYAMSAVVNVAVIRQLSALARLRVRELGIFKAVMSCMGVYVADISGTGAVMINSLPVS